jgi:hypothetical protein
MNFQNNRTSINSFGCIRTERKINLEPRYSVGITIR